MPLRPIVSAFLLGLAAIGFGIWLLATGPSETATDYHRLVDGDGERVTAVVDRAAMTSQTVGSRKTRRIETHYCPSYEFELAGDSHRVQGLECAAKKADVEIGAEGTVVYDPADPAIAFVDDDATEQRYADDGGFPWPAIGSIGAGVLVVLIGGLLLRVRLAAA